MSRLRARLGRTAADREVQGHLDEAQKSLRRALAVCARVQSQGPGEEARRAKMLQVRVVQVMGLLDNGERLSSGWDHEDPDLRPEGLKFPGWHRPVRSERPVRLKRPKPEPAVSEGSD